MRDMYFHSFPVQLQNPQVTRKMMVHMYRLLRATVVENKDMKQELMKFSDNFPVQQEEKTEQDEVLLYIPYLHG
jgi:hypothetical protein